MNVARNGISVEDIHILLQFSNDEVAILIVKVSHWVRVLAEGVLGPHHQVVELFFDLVGGQLLDYGEVGFEGLELFNHPNYFKLLLHPHYQ